MARKAKNLTCRQWRCEEPVFLGGLCKTHHEENVLNEQSLRAAIEALTTRTIDGALPKKPGLKDELLKASRWWDQACMALQSQRQDKILLEETETATEWCIAIAKAIIQEEKNFLAGKDDDYTCSYLKRISWERFENLEAGLMSNGIKRPKRDVHVV